MYMTICNNSDKHTTVISIFATAVYSLSVRNASFFGRRGVGVEVNRTDTLYMHMKVLNTSSSDKNEEITNKTLLDIA